MKRTLAVVLAFVFSVCTALAAEKAEKKPTAPETRFKSETFAGLELRGIGPGLMSGRVGDIAVDPKNHNIWYVGVASGGVWKTINHGITWTSVFDDQGSYSIGCVTVDPNDSLTIWIGTGENNSQRSVGFGDGVYKSADGGKSWENVGLKNSEHIGKIVIDPRSSKTVYVAAQGPLWSSGGDRGLYKTTNGGTTWTQSLKISDNTGVSDVAIDPRNPDVLYASAYQRRRHVWTLIDGGPESALYKSTDAGASWKKLENGLPKVEMGRIGLAISPVNPDVVYAVIEAGQKKGGFFRSTDAGGNWEKMSDYVPGGPQYYNELFADPKNVDRVYSIDVFMKVTDDGGKTFHNAGEKFKHVDNHVIWIDPDNANHVLVGCDGGLYESYDRCSNWFYFSNLPVTQFYRVAVDNATPFYNIYGGTQDNNTIGGPSRTISSSGIVNSDWLITVGGDGFWSQVDPEDPNIIYSESQYGGLVRFDKRCGEKLDIQPQPGKGEDALRFNWDSPLIISPHSHTRLYFAANKLFRSDDRGNTWKAVSPDLTRQIDRNKLKVMGRVWSVDSVAKNDSTSLYGNIVSLDESPLKEGLIYVGTDDGLIQVTEDGGATWRKIDHFPGVPDTTYCSRVKASVKNPDVAFAAFDNHKMGDFKPYLLMSTDRGTTWISIAGDLPNRGPVYAVVQDFEKPDLLFAGTEFGLYFTVDYGKKWLQLKGGLPVISVKDIAIQKRENDLVIASFGRGFFVLDDYTPLRKITPQTVDQDVFLFPVKPAWMFIQSEPLGLKEKSNQGQGYYSAPNPPFGAVFTYYLKDEIKAQKKIRQEEEKKLAKDGKDIFYPTWEALKTEDREEEPAIILTVADADGNVIRRLSGPVTSGFHRVAWDLRFPPSTPANLKGPDPDNPYDSVPEGQLAAPGTYVVNMAKRVNGKLIPIGEPQSFATTPLGTVSLPASDRASLIEFEKKTARLQRAVLGAIETANEAQTQLTLLKKALDDTPAANTILMDQTRALELRLKDIQVALEGDRVKGSRNEPTPPAISDRVQGIVAGHWSTTSAPTQTHRQAYDIAADEFGGVLENLRTLIGIDLKNLEQDADTAGAPWTPGRLPTWKKE